MMKKTIGLCALLITSTLLSAQPEERDELKKREEIERQKIAYISSELALTEEESKSFWPVYDTYQSEIEKFHESRWEIKKESRVNEKPITEAELDRQMETKFELQRQRIALEQQYYERFKGVLPIEKVADLYEAEVGFKKELMLKLRESRGREEGRVRETRERPQEQR